MSYDQLNARLWRGISEPNDSIGLIFCETPWKAQRRPYHKQKLALLLANQRHFALEQAQRGHPVRYLIGRGSYLELLETVISEVGKITMVEPAERELRNHLSPLVAANKIDVVPHSGWLTTQLDFEQAQDKTGAWRMDKFYRGVRKRTGILMEPNGKPVGDKYSFDDENRKPWRGKLVPPSRPSFEPDAITKEVCEMVEHYYGDHPGKLKPQFIPATEAQAREVWRHAKEACLENFGEFEDAMTVEHRRLFHTGLSELLNLHRLWPRTIVDEALSLDIPLNSKEGFIRQIIGWREFVRHVHRATDGFRLNGHGQRIEGSRADFLKADDPLPPVFWGEKSGLTCLDHVVEEVLDDGYTHHINRLMVLSNWATLLGVNSEEVNRWFWACFTDAYEWVVEPNVLAMGTYGTGPTITTKPYISGSGYIKKMSDYCGGCRFNPQKDCPMTPMYWNFLQRHESKLSTNPRMKLVMASLRKRSPERKAEDADIAQSVRVNLQEGKELKP